MTPQTWLLATQQRLADRVGEPVLLTIRVAYDDWFEVEVSTFTDRFGLASGRELEVAIEEAVVMLLEMDEVIAEVEAARAEAALEEA